MLTNRTDFNIIGIVNTTIQTLSLFADSASGLHDVAVVFAKSRMSALTMIRVDLNIDSMALPAPSSKRDRPSFAALQEAYPALQHMHATFRSCRPFDEDRRNILRTSTRLLRHGMALGILECTYVKEFSSRSDVTH
jgi:hypothetical protein